MKAEAPDKIYVHKSQYWGLMANEHNITKDDIEYTRTDAFIEKALDFIRSCTTYDGLGYKVKCVNIEEFKNYMKRE